MYDNTVGWRVVWLFQAFFLMTDLKKGGIPVIGKQRMCTLEYSDARLHLETNYVNCIIMGAAPSVRFSILLRGD